MSNATQTIPTAAAARAQYQSAIAAEYRSTIKQLEEEGVEALLDWQFTGMLIPHLNGSHDHVFATSVSLAEAVQGAMNKKFDGAATIFVKLGSPVRGSSEKRLLVQVTPQSGAFTEFHKDLLWNILTNLVNGAGDDKATVSMFVGSCGWIVNPSSRTWFNEAFEEYVA